MLSQLVPHGVVAVVGRPAGRQGPLLLGRQSLAGPAQVLDGVGEADVGDGHHLVAAGDARPAPAVLDDVVARLALDGVEVGLPLEVRDLGAVDEERLDPDRVARDLGHRPGDLLLVVVTEVLDPAELGADHDLTGGNAHHARGRIVLVRRRHAHFAEAVVDHGERSSLGECIVHAGQSRRGEQGEQGVLHDRAQLRGTRSRTRRHRFRAAHVGDLRTGSGKPEAGGQELSGFGLTCAHQHPNLSESTAGL